MKIKLNLTKHCVETEAKRLYNRALSLYFRTDSDKERLEAQIGLLEEFLKTSDFNALRSRHRPLAGGSDAEVFLTSRNRRHFSLLINGIEIDLD